MNKIPACIALSTLCSCATVFKAKTTPVSITSNTPGATVTIDGRPAGVTPLTLELPNKADAMITVASGGKQETCRMVSNASVGWVVADVFLTSGLGLIIDWVTHAWNDVGPNACHVDV
jgi:PEGA domain